MPNKPLNYESYLKLDVLLSAQEPLSFKAGRPAHDEMLFISIHHTYEIWFKQLLFELDSIVATFKQKSIDEKQMGTMVARLNRMNEIMKVLVLQVDVLETMTPMDFLEFRDLIFSASGFQSYQFRLFENKLGLLAKDRLPFHEKPYHAELSKNHAADVQKAEKEPNLFECLDAWLTRTPFLAFEGFDFWEKYKEATNIMFQHDEHFIEQNPMFSSEEKTSLKRNIDQQKLGFLALFSEPEYEQLRLKGEWRLSYKAIHAALLIQLYRDQPIFQLPFRLLTEVLNLDSHLTQWRYRHTSMVRRMLGRRLGTGGSTGADYLQKTAEHNKIFDDFYKLTTFFVSRTRLPKLPAEYEKQLGFAFRPELK